MLFYDELVCIPGTGRGRRLWYPCSQGAKTLRSCVEVTKIYPQPDPSLVHLATGEGSPAVLQARRLRPFGFRDVALRIPTQNGTSAEFGGWGPISVEVRPDPPVPGYP
eukprot:59997-Rhodomonas_salina.1